MGKKEDKQALNAYQAASMLGAFGQGFATPDSGYGRTAAALADSAQGSIAAQANYMAAKKAKKKGFLGKVKAVTDPINEIVNTAGTVATIGMKGANMVSPSTPTTGTPAGKWETTPVGNVPGESAPAKSVTQLSTPSVAVPASEPNAVSGTAASLSGNPSGPGAKKYLDANYESIKAGISVPQAAAPTSPLAPVGVDGAVPTASPASAAQYADGIRPATPGLAPATPAQTAATTGDWVAPVILGAAGALGAGALINSKKQPLATKAQAAQTTPSAVMGVVAPGQVGGANMTAEQLKLADPITQAAWARDNAGAMTRDHWKIMDAGTRRMLKKQGVVPPASNVQKIFQGVFGGQQQGRYVYDPNGGTQ